MKKSAFKIILILGLCIALLFSTATVAQAKTTDVSMHLYSLYTNVGSEGGLTHEEYFLVYADGVWETEHAITNVQFDVWTTSKNAVQTFNGTADGANWRAWFNISQFGDFTGLYHINAYAIDDLGRRGYLGSTSINVLPDSATLTSTLATASANLYADAPKKNGTFKVHAVNIAKSDTVAGVMFRVYCNNNMSDEYRYIAAYNGKGGWTATVNIANHLNAHGLYKIDGFALNAAGEPTYFSTATVYVP